MLLENGQSAVRDQLHNIMSMTMLLLIPTSSVCFAKVFFFALPLRECLGFMSSSDMFVAVKGHFLPPPRRLCFLPSVCQVVGLSADYTKTAAWISTKP